MKYDNLIDSFFEEVAIKDHKLIMDFVEHTNTHDPYDKINRVYIERDQTPTLLVYRYKSGSHFSMELRHKQCFDKGCYSIKSWLTAPYEEKDPFKFACGKNFSVFGRNKNEAIHWSSRNVES